MWESSISFVLLSYDNFRRLIIAKDPWRARPNRTRTITHRHIYRVTFLEHPSSRSERERRPGKRTENTHAKREDHGNVLSTPGGLDRYSLLLNFLAQTRPEIQKVAKKKLDGVNSLNVISAHRRLGASRGTGCRPTIGSLNDSIFRNESRENV